MNAQDLIDQLTLAAESNGIELKDLEVRYRETYDNDTQEMNWVMPDLFDSETNSVLESVVIMDDGNHYEDEGE